MNRGAGFTLLEVLVVIGIIVFMIAMMGIMLRDVPNRSRIAATKALIQQIATALDTYNGAFHTLPPDTGYGLPRGGSPNYDAGSLYRFLAKSPKIGNALPLIVLSDNLRDYNDPLYGPSKMIVDAWGNPIGYIGDPRRLIHNRNGFDIFSSGPDKKTACDDGIDNGQLFNVLNRAYDGAGKDDASELGESALNGTLPDDLNNWSAQ